MAQQTALVEISETNALLCTKGFPGFALNSSPCSLYVLS
jgi:hypothetical protein